MLTERRITQGLALIVFLIASAVYLTTLFPTVPFWDAGEFIAVSKILGVPHPPGTPFYVLLGRIATMVPWRSVAERVNALSAIPAALAVMLTYLTTAKLARIALAPKPASSGTWEKLAGGPKAKGEAAAAAAAPREALPPWIESLVVHVAGLMAAFMLAFSDSFWENSIEAEVYALMSLAQILVFWLGLKWWEEHERQPTSGPLLVAVYVMWLCVGLHLGVGIMGLPLFLLVWLVDRRAAMVFLMPLLTVVLVTMGLERMAAGVMLLSMVTFLTFAFQRKLPSWAAWTSIGLGLWPVMVAFGDSDLNPFQGLLAAASVAVPLVVLARGSREGRIMAVALLLMVVGYSTHAYLPIRAAQHPAVNEGNPSNWNNLRDLLERKQYGQMNMFVRRAPWDVQLNKEFWRYFSRQWPIFPRPGAAGSAIPMVLGIVGGIWLLRRNGTSFLYTGAFFGLTTAGMIIFLNFSGAEVRERDYFFQSGYHAFAIWIGLGSAWLIRWVADSFKEQRPRTLAAAATAVLVMVQPVLLVRNLWFTHDRRGNFVARDYAYNMLKPLAPNSFIFTNGDNDTFPLWYVQEVENFRKDVRVVNLSLLNTDWYIRQLRDEEPKVPMRLSDDEINYLGAGAIRDSTGNIMYTNDFMVRHIMKENRAGGRWSKQPYFAVTVPDDMGFKKHFALEGLVYKVYPDTVTETIDAEVTRKALYEDFRYRGLFFDDGSWDSTVYKDENASTLSRNYAAAHLQLAFYYRRHGERDRSVAEMERVARMFPDYTDIMVPLGSFYLDAGDTARALELFQRLVNRSPRDAEARYYYAVLLSYSRKVPEAIRELEEVIHIDPGYQMAYFAAYYTLADNGQLERALTYLERWLQVSPGDDQTRALLEQQRRQLGQGPPQTLPRPPVPQLP